MAQTTKKSGGAKKYGRKSKKPAHMRYNNEDRRFKNKLKRVLKSSGQKAAAAYRKRRLLRMRAED